MSVQIQLNAKVRMKDLQTPGFNGMEATVVAPKSEAERADLRERGRVKVLLEDGRTLAVPCAPATST
jgi:hypothetical protein